MLNTPFMSVVVPLTMVLSLVAMSSLTVASMSSVVSCESTRMPLMTAAWLPAAAMTIVATSVRIYRFIGQCIVYYYLYNVY